MKKTTPALFIVALLIVSASALVAAIAVASPASAEGALVQTLKKKLAGFYTNGYQDRVYVQTDKSFYKPGETVWFTAYVRNENTMKPSDQSDIVHVELINPRGAVVQHYRLVANSGSAQGDFDLTDFTGGIYTLKAYTEWQKNDTSLQLFEKELTVQQVIMPRLKMKIDFAKKAYGRGDEVAAHLAIHTNEDQALANKEVKFTVQIGGKTVEQKSATTDAEGKVTLSFSLPKDLATPDGLLNVQVPFEGSTESISRSIPIVLHQINLSFFPEGGDWVSEVNSRVAFRATNEWGKPADIEGIVVDEKGAFVQHFSSFHFGMGAFNFTPKAGKVYRARITKPEGIIQEYKLPDALKVGYVLRVQEQQKNKLSLRVYSFRNEAPTLVAVVRGKIYYAQTFNAVKGDNTVSINLTDFPMGVSQITLFDSKGIARNERLVFVHQERQLTISVSSDKKQYKPREEVVMDIRVTDESGLPVPGNFSLSVVDDNLLSFADDRQGNILSKMFLEPELKEKVEEPNFYFDQTDSKSNQALDYLLMTDGWRRYTWEKIQEGYVPAVRYRAEKAVLSGTVWDRYLNKPVAGAVVKIDSSEVKTWSDKEGKFELKGFDISLAHKLIISAEDYNALEQNLSDYSTGKTFFLMNKKAPVFYDMAEPMVVGMQIERRQRFMGGGVNEGIVATKNAQAEELPQAMRADLAPSPVAPPDLIEEENMQQPTPPSVGDLRDAALQKSGKKEAAEAKAVYYRAKEFPPKKYRAADTVRNDFATTVFWDGKISTDRYGKARVRFVTNDLISSFRTTIEGFGIDGTVGRAEYQFITNQPFSIDLKIPSVLVSGDKVMIPVFLKNNSPQAIVGRLTANSSAQLLLTEKDYPLNLQSGEAQVVYLSATATDNIGEGSLQVVFDSERYKDALSRNISVIAKGFPANISLSGADLQKSFSIYTKQVVPGSMKVSFTAYPSVMNELMSGIDAIIREPYGCFEQASSSNYPNILALQYLRTMKVNNPELEAKAKKLLEQGYKKLTSYETKENGYEWFGAAPAHEALTAYGLMEFEDMKSVYAGVDQAMIDRTAKLLLSRRDGEGGFKKNPRALDSFGAADADITNCYIVYALTEAGLGKELNKEIDAGYRAAKKNSDPYMLALMANALFNTGDAKRANELIALLKNLQQKDGSWTGKRHSITRSTGKSLQIETTALVALALVKSGNPDELLLTPAIKFLVGSRSGYGGFGSTQGTILALKALTKYAEFSRQTAEAGTVQILVNGKIVSSKSYEKGAKGNVVIDGLASFIQPGKQKIEVRFTGCKKALPYAMNIAYATILPESDPRCVVDVKTQMNSRTAKVGETLRLTTTLSNKTNEGQPMTLTIVGIPAGFTAQPWQLKELKEKGTVDFYEMVGNDVAFFYRALAPNEKKTISLDLKAELPGEFEAPATSAYLYYTNENKTWVGGDRVIVTP